MAPEELRLPSARLNLCKMAEVYNNDEEGNSKYILLKTFEADEKIRDNIAYLPKL